jgi:antitoxin (DNA-binding transcriptional repressor) of toxin-antitoxin stability system
MADYLPAFQPGQAVTFTASADVVGGRLVSVSGPRTVAPAGADSAAVAGVAGLRVEAGESVTVYTRGGGVQRLTAAGAIAAGAKVASAADGKAQTIGALTNAIGIALGAATADNDVIDVLFV